MLAIGIDLMIMQIIVNVFLQTASMGIQGLSKLVADVAAHAIKENEIKNYFGRKIAIDAPMSLYQFLTGIRYC
jgi:hypothetical protein